MMKRIWALFQARNLEFLRDRSTLAWNLLLPFLLVFGLAVLFSGDGRPLFKAGVIAAGAVDAPLDQQLHPFLATRHVEFYRVPDSSLGSAIQKVGRHQVDMLLDLRPGQMQYWVNEASTNGYFLQQLLQADNNPPLQASSVEGEQIRYVDWVVPGILGMNIMFSCLFGVGYVIVRYRKSGYLKRLNATPISATEFLLAQMLSRLVLVVFFTVIVFAGCHLLLHFVVEGSYLNLLIVLVLGTFALIALGLVVAARVKSEELAGGLLNLLTWPMLLLSGVWFSMEGSPAWLQWVSQLSPLTHLLEAMRAIMLDGAGLADIWANLAVLGGMSVLFLLLGAWLFQWTER